MDAELICDLIKTVGKESIQEMLEAEIIRLANQMNVTHNVNDTQVPFIAEALLETYPTESLADFILVFKRLAIGFYGNTYHKLDCATLFECMTKHIEEKSMYRERDNTTSKKKEKENEVDYEAFKKRIKESAIDERENRIKEIVNESEYAEFKRTVRPSFTSRARFIDMLKQNGLARLAEIHEKKNPTDLVMNFKVEDKTIVAKDEEEAQEIYCEVYV